MQRAILIPAARLSLASGTTDIPLTKHGEDVVRELAPKVVGPGSKSAFPQETSLGLQRRSSPTRKLIPVSPQNSSTPTTSRPASSHPASVRARPSSSCLRATARSRQARPTRTPQSGTTATSRASPQRTSGTASQSTQSGTCELAAGYSLNASGSVLWWGEDTLRRSVAASCSALLCSC